MLYFIALDLTPKWYMCQCFLIWKKGNDKVMRIILPISQIYFQILIIDFELHFKLGEKNLIPDCLDCWFIRNGNRSSSSNEYRDAWLHNRSIIDFGIAPLPPPRTIRTWWCLRGALWVSKKKDCRLPLTTGWFVPVPWTINRWHSLW